MLLPYLMYRLFLLNQLYLMFQRKPKNLMFQSFLKSLPCLMNPMFLIG
jgi:histidinol phosphatase-like enzyme